MGRYVEDGSGRRLWLGRSLAISKDQNVYVASDENGNERVVKWSVSPKETEREIENYALLDGNGVDVPRYDESFRFPFGDDGQGGERVLVTERLRPCPPGDYRRIFRHVARVLKQMRSIGCHSDVKPDNIMYSEERDRYLLIDFGGLSTVRHKYGFKREIWTPLFASQVSWMEDAIVTPRNDLYELLFSANWFYWADVNGVTRYDYSVGFVNEFLQRNGCVFDQDSFEELKKAVDAVFHETDSRTIGNRHPDPFFNVALDRIEDIDERNVLDADYDDLISAAYL